MILSLGFVEVVSGAVQTYKTPLYTYFGQHFHVSAATLSWAVIGPGLALVAATPAMTRLGDIHGHRRLLHIAVALVAAGTILVAVAPTFPVLVTGAVLQGFVGPFLPLMFGLTRARYPQDRTRRAVAYLSATLLFGAVVGSIMAGPLVTAGGRGWALGIPAALTVLALVVLWAGRGNLEEEAPAQAGMAMDWPGAALLGGGLFGFVLAIDNGARWGWTSPATLGWAIGGLAVLAVWAWAELRARQPLVDVRFLLRPRLLPVFGIGFAVYFTIFGLMVPNATFLGLPSSEHLGYGFGLSADKISLTLAAYFAAMTVTAMATRMLGARIGYRPLLLFGCFGVAIGAGGLVWAHTTLAAFVVFLAVLGAGFGFLEGGTRTVVIEHIRQGEIAVGEGVYELSIGLGSTIGAATTAAILRANTPSHLTVATEHGYEMVWIATAIAALAAVLVAAAYALRPTRSAPNPSAETSHEAAKPDQTRQASA